MFAVEESVRHTVEDSTGCGACGRANKWAMGFFVNDSVQGGTWREGGESKNFGREQM